MNAHPSSRSSPRATLLGLVERSREFYVVPPQPLQLDIVPSDAPAQGCRLHLGAQLGCTALDEPSPPGAPPIAAVIELPANALEWMLANPEVLDLRSPEFAAACAGRLVLRGERVAAEFWVQLLKRPSRDDARALAAARAQAPAYVHSADIEDEGLDPARAVCQAIARCAPRRLREAVPLARRDWRLLCNAALPADGYTGGTSAPAALVDAIDWPALPARAFTRAQLWAGRRTGGALTRLHCDAVTSLLAHLEGRKHVLMFSPRERDKLAPLDAFNSFQPCRLNPLRPDLQRFPGARNARGVHVELAPGDLLVIPTGWYHTTWAEGEVASVSRFVRDALLAPPASAAA